jgi:hypothetical protein
MAQCQIWRCALPRRSERNRRSHRVSSAHHRAAFTLGGAGGGIAYKRHEFEERRKQGIRLFE